MGLKENVIIGKLIPAGAGLAAYRKLAEELVPEVETEEQPEQPVDAVFTAVSEEPEAEDITDDLPEDDIPSDEE